MQDHSTLAETRMIRASKPQVVSWVAAAERAGYWSASEWIRTELDAASGAELPVEIVADSKALAVFVPNRAKDVRPFLVEMARYEEPEKLVQLVLDVADRPWCTPPVLKRFLSELARVVEGREAEKARGGVPVRKRVTGPKGRRRRSGPAAR